MAKLKITDFYTYRFRYAIGLLAIITLLTGLVSYATFFTPGGLSDSEKTSVVTSAATPLSTLLGAHPDYIINLPYHLLQRASFSLFEFSIFSIKLPSIILAVLSLMMLYGVIRLWFRRNTAVVTGIITVCSALFLTISQLGSPEISYFFFSAALLFSTSLIAHTTKFRPVWLLASALLAGLSLYTPLGIYPIIALGVTALIHPHARFIVFRQSLLLRSISIVVFLVTITPLIISSIKEPHLLLTLSGIEYLQHSSLSSSMETLRQYFDVYRPHGGIVLTPIYHLTVLALAILGAARLFTAKYTAKSYIMTITFILLLVACLVQGVSPAITLAPVMLLVAFGIDYLIRSWYRLFPRNPYARIAGLIPLTVLVLGIATSEIERYTLSFHNLASSTSVYSSDLTLLNQELNKQPKTLKMTIIVNESDESFYEVFSAQTKRPIVATSNVRDAATTGLIITDASKMSAGKPASHVLVDGDSSNSARFYLYKNGY